MCTVRSSAISSEATCTRMVREEFHRVFAFQSRTKTTVILWSCAKCCYARTWKTCASWRTSGTTNCIAETSWTRWASKMATIEGGKHWFWSLCYALFSCPVFVQDSCPATVQDSCPAIVQDCFPATVQDSCPAMMLDSCPATVQDSCPATVQDSCPAMMLDIT